MSDCRAGMFDAGLEYFPAVPGLFWKANAPNAFGTLGADRPGERP
jgi:hypothetical protein